MTRALHWQQAHTSLWMLVLMGVLPDALLEWRHEPQVQTGPQLPRRVRQIMSAKQRRDR